MNKNFRKIAVVTVASLAAVALAYQASVTTLYQDGKIVSSNLKTVDGQLYVPVKDLVTYLGGTLKTSDDRADITTTAGQSATTGGEPQAIAPDLTQPIAQPASPMATVNAPPPPPPPTQLNAAINGDIAFGDYVYRVTSVESQPNQYRQQFDQRGMRLHPQWKADKLVIVYLTAKNNGSEASSLAIPGGSDFTVFDEREIGYPATDMDIPQTPQVVGSDMFDYDADMSSPVSILGPGGKVSFAVIGSIPKGSTAKSIRFHLSAPAGTAMANAPASSPNPSGADVTVSLG
jgi:hypothetical protein